MTQSVGGKRSHAERGNEETRNLGEAPAEEHCRRSRRGAARGAFARRAWERGGALRLSRCGMLGFSSLIMAELAASGSGRRG